MKIVNIYTWGNKKRKPPSFCQHHFNVCNVTGGYKPRGVNLKKIDGRDSRLQVKVERGRNYYRYLEAVINKIENDGLTDIGINCHKGRHRSVAFAELTKIELEKLGYEVNLIHMELK